MSVSQLLVEMTFRVILIFICFYRSTRGLSLGKRLRSQPFTQVISDVDDTLKSSGGLKIGEIALGGIDTQYERGQVCDVRI